MTKLIVEDDGGFPYVLHDTLVYQSAVLNSRLSVPVGFKTDLFSIPQPLQWLLPKSMKGDPAAVVHDFLYATAAGGCTREQADQVLREALTVCGVGKIRRNIIYAGVRVGGDVPWEHYRSQSTPPTVAA